MTSLDFIIKELRDLHNNFTSSNIRYEFNEFTGTHLIEVTPLEFYNSEDYMNYELQFEDLFLEKFPKEDIIFLSDDSLNKITNPIFEIYCQKIGNFITDFVVLSDIIDFHGSNQNEYLDAEENNYALAA